MIVKPTRLQALMRVLETANPYIVIVSIFGLWLEYITPVKTAFSPWLIYANRFIDAIFVFDFIIRLICFPAKRYFLRGYGWVDMLASIPGFMLVLRLPFLASIGALNIGFLSILKFIRIGRFFKIIRLLRFLRIFSFLKKMRGDSTFIQERIMKIGITIVLIFVVGIAFMDGIARGYFDRLFEQQVRERHAQYNNITETAQSFPDTLLFYTRGGRMFDRDGKEVREGFAAYNNRLNQEWSWYVIVPFSSEQATFGDVLQTPVDSVALNAHSVMRRHDMIMFVMVTTLIVILVVIIFYIGFIFAQDMRIVQLIIDSIDADDYMLLQEEAKLLSHDGTTFVIEEGEDEIESLLKMVAKLVRIKEKNADYADSEADLSITDLSAVSEGLGYLDESAASATPPIDDHADIELDIPQVDESDISMSIDSDVGEFGPPPAESTSHAEAGSIREAVEIALRGRHTLSEQEIKRIADRAAVHAVKVSTKSIVEYIKKHIG